MKLVIKAATKRILFEFLKFAALAGVLVLLISAISGTVDYNWQWYRVEKYLFRKPTE